MSCIIIWDLVDLAWDLNEFFWDQEFCESVGGSGEDKGGGGEDGGYGPTALVIQSLESVIYRSNIYQIGRSEAIYPTDDDYNAGYMIRYFIRMINNNRDTIREVSKNSYNSLSKNFLYKTIQIKWKISGTQESVISANDNIWKNADLEMPGIYKYLSWNESQYWKNVADNSRSVVVPDIVINSSQIVKGTPATPVVRSSGYRFKIFTLAVQSTNTPTELDYSSGYMARYFCKQANNKFDSVKEISQSEYKSVENNILYKSATIQWRVSGDKSKVEIENINAIDFFEQELSGLKYLLNNPLQYFDENYTPPASVKSSVSDYTVNESLKSEIIPTNDIPKVSSGYTANKQAYIPTAYKRKPTEQEYSAGYMTRYFCKQVNNISAKVIEISESDYNIVKNDFLYKSIFIKWVITGKREVVKSYNENSLIDANKELLTLRLDLLEYWKT